MRARTPREVLPRPVGSAHRHFCRTAACLHQRKNVVGHSLAARQILQRLNQRSRSLPVYLVRLSQNYRSIVILKAQVLKVSGENLAVADPDGEIAYIEAAKDIRNHSWNLRVRHKAELPVAYDVNVALGELPESAVLWPFTAPHFLDLVPAKWKDQVVVVLCYVPSERNR